MNLIWMMLAFLIIAGIALIYCSLLKVNTGEGVLLAAASIIALMYAGGGFFGTFTVSMYAIFALSALGYLSGLFVRIKKGSMTVAFWRCPYMIALFLLFAFAVVVFAGDFIQHIDEFHQWAAAVKYMLETDLMPGTSPLLDSSHPYGTSMFYLFFQKITGYSEGNMYASAFLLMWIGFLLPLSEYKMRDWKKVAAYTVILYISLFSLYHYGAKNLYVDLQTAAWAGGLAGWWMNRTKKKSNGLIAAAGLFMLCFFKMMAGPLMAIFVLIFILMQTFIVEKGILGEHRQRKKFLTVALVFLGLCIAVAAVVVLWAMNTNVTELLSGPLLARRQILQIDDEKINLTCSTFLTVVTGRTIASYSTLKIAFVPFIVLMIVLAKISADMYHQKKEQIVYTIYIAVNSLLYCAVLLMAYIFVFSYEESITAAGSSRYLSLWMIYLFVIMLTWFFKRERGQKPQVKTYLALGMLLVFLSGLNMYFIPTMTGLDRERVPGYTDISTAKEQISYMEEILTENDRIYLIDQASTTEYITNTAQYYLGERVSNYLIEPWRFMEEGSRIRLADSAYPTIMDFPALLQQGGYTYVWIYQSNKYLKNSLPEAIACDEIKGAALYRVVYEQGIPVYLELSMNFETLSTVREALLEMGLLPEDTPAAVMQALEKLLDAGLESENITAAKVQTLAAQMEAGTPGIFREAKQTVGTSGAEIQQDETAAVGMQGE
ncbi:MAG: hypothetical protein Q4C50_08595 [Eubacteriales bacterium]|nr:hypothetical protein [Eubacteriales bacterium]